MKKTSSDISFTTSAKDKQRVTYFRRAFEVLKYSTKFQSGVLPENYSVEPMLKR
jgi:hypothetical protein